MALRILISACHMMASRHFRVFAEKNALGGTKKVSVQTFSSPAIAGFAGGIIDAK